jgi:aminoglycoside 6'-N-acetyltransferase I
MRIVDLQGHDPGLISQAATLLLKGFADTGSVSWQTAEQARLSVQESLQEGRISRIALDGADEVVGWIGGICAYDGHAWELHPLVVRRDCRGQGIGRALVSDLENEVQRRGGTTLYLGTDDENGRTSLGGIDLYPDVLGALRTIQSLRAHPFDFYRKLGFAIVGALPDANGFGKPDIFMAKRVSGGAVVRPQDVQ